MRNPNITIPAVMIGKKHVIQKERTAGVLPSVVVDIA
jgi:hypothetical protein